MIDGWVIVGVALLYLSSLFALAWVGDRRARKAKTTAGRPMVYALSLAVYCTSWTFFGSVGLAATTGFDFIPVYIGPILMFLVGQPLLLKVVRIAKSQNLTSVADFMSARYGKSFAVAAVVTIVAMLGLMPYIALQLKAISVSIETVVGNRLSEGLLQKFGLEFFGVADTAFLITIALAVFAILFGTRRIEATESQEGLMLAVAAESVVKLFAFIAVGVLAIYTLFGGIGDFVGRLAETPHVLERFTQGLNGGSWLTVTVLSFSAILLLPRQFHVTIVENRSEAELKRARWLFPLYLVLINLFVVPIAAGGLMTFDTTGRDPDFYMLALPMAIDSKALTLFAFVGGLSAATAMVIVESVALSIMVCNSLVVPFLLRRNASAPSQPRDMNALLMLIRRIAIAVLLLLGYIVYHTLGHSRGLAAIGLLSFAAVAQFAPAFLLGLIWRKGTARGAISGMIVGTGVWAYTLVLPWVVSAGWFPQDIISDGPLGITMLRPQALFFLQFEPLTHGVLWSLSANLLTYVFVSLLRVPVPIERLQAQLFIEDEPLRPAQMPAYKLWRSNISLGELEACVARYLGGDRAQRSFEEFLRSRNSTPSRDAEADIPSVRFAENLLSSAIGAASARLVLTLLLKRGSVSNQSAMRLLDDASEALQYNRDLLQSALDQVRHGLSVFDKDMRLICWNRQFRELLDLPADIGRVGTPLDRILRVCAERGDFGPGDLDRLVESRLYKLAVRKETFQERILEGRRQIEIRTSSMPQGGIVTTFSDITDRVAAANALARANESLERRVRERTAELLEVNAALAIAKSKADQANLDKTRFLAAASHDILQPLNAARLYATSLVERPLEANDLRLANNVDASLSAVEEIFSALIEISRMDAGRLEPETSEFPLAEMFAQLKVEFEPMAREKNLELRTFTTRQWVRSDRRLLRRVLQNLVSNAIKYTRSGGVLLGARVKGDSVVVQVLDTGPGIPEDKRTVIFKEFQRLEGPGSTVRGLGLGLSIVERICRVLEHPILLDSRPLRGSTFAVRIPRAEPRATPSTQSAAAPSPGNLAGCAVLCIDNEPVVLSGMETLLTGWGCNVRTAASAVDALSVLSNATYVPDIILADYHLDNGTGVDAILRLRKELGQPVPAVLITADHSLEVQREVRAHDIPLLRKPLKAGSLRAILSKIAITRQAAAE